MALIDCPECKGRVSDLARECPHCGFPMEDSRVDGTLETHGFCVACHEHHKREWQRGTSKHFFRCRKTGRLVILRDGEDQMKEEF
jgi:hypothetical protein